jgi:hypothetical protein
MPKYNHMYTIAFEVSGSTTDTGSDAREMAKQINPKRTT